MIVDVVLSIWRQSVAFDCHCRIDSFEFFGVLEGECAVIGVQWQTGVEDGAQKGSRFSKLLTHLRFMACSPTDELLRFAVAHCMQYSIEATGIIDRLLEPHHLFIFCAGIFLILGVLFNPLALVRFGGGEYENERECRAREHGRLIQRQDILKAEFGGDAKVVYELGENFRV